MSPGLCNGTVTAFDRNLTSIYLRLPNNQICAISYTQYMLYVHHGPNCFLIQVSWSPAAFELAMTYQFSAGPLSWSQSPSRLSMFKYDASTFSEKIDRNTLRDGGSTGYELLACCLHCLHCAYCLYYSTALHCSSSSMYAYIYCSAIGMGWWNSEQKVVVN